MKTSLLLAINVALIFAANAPAQEMPGGLWEIKTKMDMPGLPAEMAAKTGAHTMTHCVKPGERKWNEQRNPNDREKQCEQTELKAPVAKPHRM